VEEATRRGRVEGRALRLPMIAAAPGCMSFLASSCRRWSKPPGALPDPAGRAAVADVGAGRGAGTGARARVAPSASGEAGVLNAPACTLSVDSLVQASARLFGHAVDPPQVELDPALCDALAQRPYRVAIETALTLVSKTGWMPRPWCAKLVAAPDP